MMVLVCCAFLFSLGDPEPPARAVELRESKARVGPVELEVVHLVDPGAPLPDLALNKPGRLALPGEAVLITPAVMVGEGGLLPPGEHRILLEVDPDEQVWVVLESAASGQPVRWRADVGEFHRPVLGLRIDLASRSRSSLGAQGGDPRRSAELLMRWHSWVVSVDLRPAATTSVRVGDWSFERPRPSGLDAVDELGHDGPTFLGTVTHEPSGVSRRAFLVGGIASDRLRVEFVDRRRESLAKTARELRRDLAAVTGDDRRRRALTSRLRSVEVEFRRVKLRDAAGAVALSPTTTSNSPPLVTAHLIARGEKVDDIGLDVSGEFGRAYFPLRAPGDS